MAVQLSSLRVAPELDASKYTAGAERKVAADRAMAASSAAAGQAVAATDARISQSGDVLARLSRQYIEGYSAQQRFNQGLGQLNRGLEAGKISIEGAERILVGMNQRLGLTANSADLAAKGQMSLAAAVERANVQIAQQTRLQAANSNGSLSGASRAAGFNAGQQLQDIAMMSLVGQDPRVLALQQGPQLATAIQQGGGLAALGTGLASLLSMTTLLTVGFTAATAATIQWFMKGKDGAKTLNETLKAHSDTLRLLKDQYGELGEAAKQVGTSIGGASLADASNRTTIALLQAQMRQQMAPYADSFRGGSFLRNGLFGDSNAGLNDLTSLTGGPYKKTVDDFLESVRQGKGDLSQFAANLNTVFDSMRQNSDAPAKLHEEMERLIDASLNAFGVTNKFAPFASAINRLTLEGASGLPKFIAEIDRIGQTDGLRKLADDAIVAGKEIVSLAEKAKELEQIQRRLEARQRGPLIGSPDEDERNRYLDDQRLTLRSQQRMFDADVAGLGARSPSELAAAARAREAARDVAGESADVRQQRIELAGKRALLEAEHSLKEAQDERLRALDQSTASQQLQLRLIGATTGESEKLRFEFERIQQLREEAARNGVPADEREIALIKAKAVEYGKYADAISRANMLHDLQFQIDQAGRTPEDQQIAATLARYGRAIDLTSADAALIRHAQNILQISDAWNDVRQTGMDAIDALTGSALNGFSDIEDVAKNIAGDILKQFAQLAIANPLKNGIFNAGLPTLDSLGGVGGFFKTLLGGANPAAGQSVGAMTVNAGNVVVTGNIGVGGGLGSDLTRMFNLANGGGGADLAAYASAIKSIESSGNYGALGPLTRGDRAYGAYQVMGANIPSWTQQALGQSMSPQQFLASPAAQDAVFNKIFGGYIAKYGNPQDAASAWLTGGPLSRGANARDILGTSGSAYVEKFNSALGSATKDLGTFGGGLNQLGSALSKFPAAPGGGGLGSGFGNVASLISAWSISPRATAAILGGSVGLYDDGGWTGHGGKFEPAGIVHRGEYVMDADTTRAIGVGNLDALRRSARRGFAAGGYGGGSDAGGSLMRPVLQFSINNYSSATVREEEEDDGSGNRRPVLVIEDQVTSAITRRGSSSRSALRQMGVKPQTKRR